MCATKNPSNWKVSGIVSFGPRDECGQGLPGVYTKVAYHMEWINVTLVENDLALPTTPEPTTEIIKSTKKDHITTTKSEVKSEPPVTVFGPDTKITGTSLSSTALLSTKKSFSSTITSTPNSCPLIKQELLLIISASICLLQISLIYL